MPRPTRLAPLLVLLALGIQVASPQPARAEWSRTLTVHIYADGTFGDGRGRVTTDDGEIDCRWNPGPPYGDCVAVYTIRDSVPSFDVTVTLDPDPGSYACIIEGLSCTTNGNSITYTMRFERASGDDPTISPSFNLRSYKVSVDVFGPGSIDGNGSPCTPTNGDFCRSFKHGSTASLKAVPDAGSNFGIWANGPACAEQPTCTFTVTEAVSLAAFFGQWVMTIERVGRGRVCVEIEPFPACATPDRERIAILLDDGKSYQVTATPAEGWRFSRWSSGPCGGQPRNCTFTVSRHSTITATFVRIPAPTPPPNPSPVPTPRPTPQPTPQPTPRVTVRPTVAPTVAATPGPAGSEAAAEGSGPVMTAAPSPNPVPTEATTPRPDSSSEPLGASPKASQAPVPATGGAGGGFDVTLLLVLASALAALLLGFGYAMSRRGRRRAAEGPTRPPA